MHLQILVLLIKSLVFWRSCWRSRCGYPPKLSSPFVFNLFSTLSDNLNTQSSGGSRPSHKGGGWGGGVIQTGIRFMWGCTFEKFGRACAVCSLIPSPYFRPPHVIENRFQTWPDFLMRSMTLPYFRPNRLYWICISSLDRKQCPFVLCWSMREYPPPEWPSTSATGPGIRWLGN